MNDELKKVHKEGMWKMIHDSPENHANIASSPNVTPEMLTHIVETSKTFWGPRTALHNKKTPAHAFYHFYHNRKHENGALGLLVRAQNTPGEILDKIAKSPNDLDEETNRRITTHLAAHNNILPETVRYLNSTHHDLTSHNNQTIAGALLSNPSVSKEHKQEIRDRYHQQNKTGYDPRKL